MNAAVTKQFRDLVAAGDDGLDLARAALQVARIQYPSMDVDDYLLKLDQMAALVGGRLHKDASQEDVLRAINRHLFAELRFAGNSEEYYDPRNSYLNDVLERRLGIPITLSIIYLEIGWRLGLPLEGVSFPGHFLVKLSVEEGEIVLDPYAGGISLGKEELEMRLMGITPPNRAHGRVMDVAQFLESAPRTEILHRMLRNLKAIYLNAKDDEKTLAIIEHMLCVRPEDVETVRDRGFVFRRLGCFRLAVEDFNRYLAARPDADDIDDVRGQLMESQRSAARLH